MQNEFPNIVADMITEDPDIMRRNNNWDFEKKLEVEELQDKSLGNYMCFVTFTAGLNYKSGEKRIDYYSDGSGHPGTPDDIEWDVLDIDEIDVYDQNGDEVNINTRDPQFIERIKTAIVRNVSTEDIKEHFKNEIESTNDDTRY